MHRLTSLILVGWLAWISPYGAERWAPLEQTYETKDACVDFLMAAARAEPDWLHEMQITCRPVGVNPNLPQAETPPPQRPGMGL